MTSVMNEVFGENQVGKEVRKTMNSVFLTRLSASLIGDSINTLLQSRPKK